jgi:molecular chaperone GrpE
LKKEEENKKAEAEAGAAPEKPEVPENPESPENPGSPEKPEAAEAATEPAPEAPAEPDWKDLYARLLADFDNYKKRAARDREDTYRFAEADILKDVLPAVDNLARALDNVKEQSEEPFVKGVRLVYDALVKSLADHGAKPMEDLVGKEPDPNFHEAIATLPDEQVPEGRISNVAKTGWMLGDRLLRAAQVVVSSGKANG